MITGSEVTGHEQAASHDESDQTGGEAKAAKVLNVDPAVVAKAKALLSQGLGQGETIGHSDTGFYKGKSLELGKGGRSLMMQDRITDELIAKGFSVDQAKAIAKKQSMAHGTSKYGAKQMQIWADAAAAKTKAVQVASQGAPAPVA